MYLYQCCWRNEELIVSIDLALTTMSEVDLLLVICGRVAWGQMYMCLRRSQLLPLFHCVGMCECMRARVTVKGGEVAGEVAVLGWE